MMQIIRKLKSKKGESLVESLCAILIFTMASIVLFSMVSTAGDINSKAKAKDAENQAHMVAVEKGESAAKNGTGTITFTFGSSVDLDVDVDIYGGKNDSLYAYFVHTAAAGG